MHSYVVAVVVCALIVGCSRKLDEGEACEPGDECRRGLQCRAGRCVVTEELYQQMARQSGVELRGERPARPAGAGAVRVRSSEGQGLVFALCADNERLVGGWCDPPGDGGDSASFTQQGADGYTDVDTIAARWKCSLGSRNVRAFALCQRVDAPATPAKPASSEPASNTAPAPP